MKSRRIMRCVYRNVLCVQIRIAVETRGGVVINTVSVCSDTPELVTSLKRCVIPSSTPDFSDADRVTLYAFVERNQHSYGCIPLFFFSFLPGASRLADSEISREEAAISISIIWNF